MHIMHAMFLMCCLVSDFKRNVLHECWKDRFDWQRPSSQTSVSVAGWILLPGWRCGRSASTTSTGQVTEWGPTSTFTKVRNRPTTRGPLSKCEELHLAWFLAIFLQLTPTRSWRIIEFMAKFLEFFVQILEFLSKSLSFFIFLLLLVHKNTLEHYAF